MQGGGKSSERVLCLTRSSPTAGHLKVHPFTKYLLTDTVSNAEDSIVNKICSQETDSHTERVRVACWGSSPVPLKKRGGLFSEQCSNPSEKCRSSSFFKPYDFPKIEVDAVCLSLGKRSERVSAERGAGSIKVAIS